MMQPMKSFVVVLAFLFIGSPVLAQPAAPVGISVAAHGGTLFGPRTVPAFGIEVGDRIHPNVQAYAAWSYFEDLMDSSLHEDLAVLSGQLTTLTGSRWNLQGRDRGVGLIVGAKYEMRSEGVKPYVGGGAGVLNLRRFISDQRAGDVTAATLTEFGIGDESLTTNGQTKPLIEATLGVGVPLGRSHLDFGYRYRRAFHFRQRIDFSQLAVGIGVNF
jgi:hypothetical protein